MLEDLGLGTPILGTHTYTMTFHDPHWYAPPSYT